MSPDGLQQVRCASVVQEENPLAQPHRGAVRNSSPLAFPWVMLSASLGPMLCSNKSENRLARFPRSAGLATFPVGRDGVWHNAQPISLNNLLPLMVDGVSEAGVGGARKIMKSAKFTPTLGAAASLVASTL